MLWDNHKNSFVKGRKKRSAEEITNGTNSSLELSFCRKLALQKLAMFKKLESFGNSVGGNWAWNSKNSKNGEDCLLRAICEIYHFPITEEFGVFGDVLRELVRWDKNILIK